MESDDRVSHSRTFWDSGAMWNALLRLLRVRDDWCPSCRDRPAVNGGCCSDECAQRWRDDFAY